MERASLILRVDGETVREIYLSDEETAKRIYEKMLEEIAKVVSKKK